MDFGKLEALAEKVRGASRAGVLVRLDEVWPGGEHEFVTLPAEARIPDIVEIREGEKTYLYSDRHMTRAYAEAAALSASGDPQRIIAATVRSDSAGYPRPTPVATFRGQPYCLSKEEVTAAVGRMRVSPQYADINQVCASDGAEFLFSSDHLSREQAASMAEWIAVGRHDNP